jgi:hypothetical protein
MDQASNNPPRNIISPGVSAEQITSAVDGSGYPLQTIVGGVLRHSFDVWEEWSYVDRDTKELRSIDIRADMTLHDWEPQPRVRPRLTMLVECKQSQLPYVFFKAKSPRMLLDHPKIYGLHKPAIEITSDDDPSTWTCTVIHALDLSEHGFQTAPVYSNTFSKCVRKGPELELSGTEAYNGLVLPLIKALDHLSESEAPPTTAWYFDAHLSVGVGVLDSTMVVAHPTDGGTKLELVPWVRVLRHEYDVAQAQRFERDRLWALDIVHRDYLNVYLSDHLVPFAQAFAKRVLAHPTEIATGQAFAAGMGADSWQRLEPRIKPRQLDAAVKRSRAIGRNFFELVRGNRKPRS